MPHERKEPSARRAGAPAVITDHRIRHADIHPNVHYVCERLREEGHSALVVGGAVRDLLLGRSPKDFDLATSARPEKIKDLFRNARIIGRRFRLVQLRYPNMSMEVATFRSEPRERRPGILQRDNRYGNSEEDALRRDFTINALSLDPISLELIDHVGGLEDLRARRIRTIKAPERSFREDPVRMLRAVRFRVRLGFHIERECEAAIRHLAPLLGEVKRHRLAEELQRFLTRGNAEETHREFQRLGLLRPLLGLEPHAWFFAADALEQPLERLLPYLQRMDAWVAAGGETIAPTVALLGLLATLARDPMRHWLRGEALPEQEPYLRAVRSRGPAMLAEWGLLNGQVVPALAIQETARQLAASRGAPLRNHAQAVRLPGVREAVLLLAVLRDVLRLPEGMVDEAVALLPRLPDLPILDHPRPAQRGAAVASPQADAAESTPRRRGRSRGRRKSASGAAPQRRAQRRR